MPPFRLDCGQQFRTMRRVASWVPVTTSRCILMLFLFWCILVPKGQNVIVCGLKWRCKNHKKGRDLNKRLWMIGWSFWPNVSITIYHRTFGLCNLCKRQLLFHEWKPLPFRSTARCEQFPMTYLGHTEITCFAYRTIRVDIKTIMQPNGLVQCYICARGHDDFKVNTVPKSTLWTLCVQMSHEYSSLMMG